MTSFSVIRTVGHYKFLNGSECIVIGRVAESDLMRVELPGGEQIDLLDCEVLSPYEARVRELEAEGCDRSDAQAIADAEELS